MRGIACVEEFVTNCSSSERRNSFQVTASGALETSTQLCTKNSQLRKGKVALAFYPTFPEITYKR